MVKIAVTVMLVVIMMMVIIVIPFMWIYCNLAVKALINNDSVDGSIK